MIDRKDLKKFTNQSLVELIVVCIELYVIRYSKICYESKEFCTVTLDRWSVQWITDKKKYISVKINRYLFVAIDRMKHRQHSFFAHCNFCVFWL